MWFYKKEKLVTPFRANLSVRMEAIGGQGANSAGKILAEAAVLGMGHTGNHFSSFGSEKRGSRVSSFVRISTEKKPVRSASFIRNPDLLVIFHESLLDTHQEVLEGIEASTDVIINTSRRPDEIRFPEGLDIRRVVCIDATKWAQKQGCGLNAIMLGAVTSLCPEVDSEILHQTLDNFFKSRPEKVRTSNSRGFREGQNDLTFAEFRRSQAFEKIKSQFLPELGWTNAPIGGVIVNPGNTVLKDNTASRKGMVPQFTKELCFNCGYCDMVCPDLCFVWHKDPAGENPPELRGIDYQYCKACQKCISVCPVEALNLVPESQLSAADLQHHLFPEVAQILQTQLSKKENTEPSE